MSDGGVRELLVRLRAEDAAEAEEILAPGSTTLEAYLEELLRRWLRSKQSDPMTAVQILDLLTNKGRRFDGGGYIELANLKEIARRIADAADCYPKNLRAPNGEDFRRVVLPVEDGKTAHALGHFTGAVALFGFAAEMLALLLYRVHEESFPPNEFDTFESLRQADRLRQLKHVLPESWYLALTRVRACRKDSLHFWSPPENPEKESLLALTDVSRVLGPFYAHEIVDGRVRQLYEPLQKYMARTGWARENK